MRAIPTLRARRGFTILEMTVSMALLLTLMGLSTEMFRRETRALSSQSGRLEAQQNGNVGLSQLDRELRIAGIGTVNGQAMLIQADSMALSFNTDLVSHDSGDLNAVYLDPDADSSSTLVWDRSARTTLPRSTFYYPDSTYLQAAGVPSTAETISYWLSLDSTKSSGNEYILFRRVNARPASVVSTGIIVNPGDTVFQYFRADTTGALLPIARNRLPLYHTADMHGAVNDTGKSALTDSIHTVHVSFKTVDHDQKGNVYRTLQTTIHLMNAGLDHRTTCGNPPLGVTPAAVVTPAGGSVPASYVTVSWSHSIDDGSGENDIRRYVIYRRLSSQTSFVDPVASVPAGQSTYTFVDTNVQSGQTWIYGVSAQDCTPSSSPIGSTTAVIIP